MDQIRKHRTEECDCQNSVFYGWRGVIALQMCLFINIALHFYAQG